MIPSHEVDHALQQHGWARRQSGACEDLEEGLGLGCEAAQAPEQRGAASFEGEGQIRARHDAVGQVGARFEPARTARDELGGQHHAVRHRLAVDAAQEQLDPSIAQSVHRLPHRRERHSRQAAVRAVVETDDGDVLRYAQAARAQRIDRAERHQVVRRDDGSKDHLPIEQPRDGAGRALSPEISDDDELGQYGQAVLLEHEAIHLIAGVRFGILERTAQTHDAGVATLQE